MMLKLLPAVLAPAAFLLLEATSFGQGPAPLPVTATKGHCRTYDTAATAVTVSSAFKVTTSAAGVFDPSSNKTTQRVNYEDSRGIRHSYTQVTTYASTEDAVAEVVRLKSPAGPTPTGIQVGVIPPLTRWLSASATGGVTFTITNSFDGQGRLTRSVSVVPQGSTTTQYTAWDASGRPTAGTVQSAASSSRLAITYDDTARASTTTTTTGTLVAVGTQTFDPNGNPRVYSHRNSAGGTSTTTTTATASATVCVGDSRAPVAPTVGPVGPSPNGTITGMINGQAWTATAGVRGSYQGQPPVLSVGGGDNRYLIGLGVTVSRGAGDYTAGPIDPLKMTKMTAKDFAEAMTRNSAIVTVFDSVTKAGWQADPSAGSGTVTVTSVSSSGATGTFSLTLAPTPNTAASGQMTLSGSFNVKF